MTEAQIKTIGLKKRIFSTPRGTRRPMFMNTLLHKTSPSSFLSLLENDFPIPFLEILENFSVREFIFLGDSEPFF